MKSYMKAAISVIALAEMANAMEHPSLTATYDFEVKWSDVAEKKANAYRAHNEKESYDVIDHSRRPVIGVLTEPLRGEMYTPATSQFKEDELEDTSAASFVSKAHVQFLEQTGIRVVPIDYRLSLEERREILDNVNGVYLPGDSHNTITDKAYKAAFAHTLAYVENATFEDKMHFPMFLMGNSLTTLVRARQASANHLTDMGKHRFTSSRVDMIGHPDQYFLFNGLDREEKQALFNTGEMFNMQVSGVSTHDIESDRQLSKLIQPIATFTQHGVDEEAHEFVAIAEGIKLPLYAFTYGIEMVQFYHEDPDAYTGTSDGVNIDHSIVARHHAQEIASLIADEARMCDHYYSEPEAIFNSLIRHEKLVSISYESPMGNNPMPKGMNEYDIYLLQ